MMIGSKHHPDLGLVLRQSGLDLVMIPVLGHADMPGQMRAAGPIKSRHRHADAVAPDRVADQR